MNWKNEAVHKLKRYNYMRRSLASIPLDLERLELDSQSLRSPDFRQIATSTGGSHRREDALVDNLMHRQELELALQRATLWVQNVEQALDAIDPTSRALLLAVYASEEPIGITQLCQQLNLERSSFYRKRDTGLEAFTLALYGSLES